MIALWCALCFFLGAVAGIIIMALMVASGRYWRDR